MTRRAGRRRTRAILRARESPCGTSRSPCSRARTRRSSARDRWSMSQAWSSWCVSSKWIGADDFAAVALAELLAFVVAHRGADAVHELLDVAAGGGGRVQEQHAAGLAPRVLPGMGDVAREERAGARPADGHVVANLEGDLPLEHPGDFVAVAMQMKEALGAGRHGFLEHHDALVGLVAGELHVGEAAGRPHVEMLSATRGYHEAFLGHHVVSSLVGHTYCSITCSMISTCPSCRKPHRSATRRERT